MYFCTFPKTNATYKKVKIFLARFFLVIFLLQNTVAGELLKLPLLVAHYKQHVHLHPKTTICGFLKMHYIDPTVVDEDYSQDMQLPFKTIDTHSFVTQLSLPPLVFSKIKYISAILKDEIVPDFASELPFYQHNGIFRPPKSS